jgi:hypothetical protein
MTPRPPTHPPTPTPLSLSRSLSLPVTQESPHGNSECIAPSVSGDKATRVYSCYHDKKRWVALSRYCNRVAVHSNTLVVHICSGDTGVIGFQNHEFLKHGHCAAIKDVHDYFEQVTHVAESTT